LTNKGKFMMMMMMTTNTFRSSASISILQPISSL